MADPGFPIGGRGPHKGDVDFRGSYVSNILYVKMKESGSLGSVRRARPLDPPMVTFDALKHFGFDVVFFST